MNPNYKHDFSSASIKHQIEAEFYKKAGEAMKNSPVTSATIVTGPDYQRHIDNYIQNFGDKKLRICEIDPMIYTDIKRGLGAYNEKKLLVINKSVELFGSAFIDCDLTCISDVDVIKNTLLKQISVQCTNNRSKAFIFSLGLRMRKETDSFSSICRPIFGVLGNIITKVTTTSENLCPNEGNFKYKRAIRFGICKGRITDYICYEYNAGGGPMLTCLIIYK